MNAAPSGTTTAGSDEAPVAVKLSRGRMVFAVSIVWLLYFLDFVARFGVNPLYPLIQKDLALTDAQVGMLGSVVLAGMAILVLPLSYLADRWSRSKLLSIMAFVWSACSVISGWTHGFGVLVAARFGLGVGEASFAPTATALLTSWFPRAAWGRVLGLFNTAVSLGIFIGSVLSGYLGATIGWRATLIAVGLPGIILGLLALWIPDAKRVRNRGGVADANAPPTVRDAAAVVLKNRSMVMLIVFYGIINMGIVTVLTWSPMYYVRVMEFPVQTAATLAGVAAVLGVLGFPLGGLLSDYLVKRDLRYRMWLPAIAALGVAVLLAIGFGSHSVAFILTGCFVSTFINPSLNAATQELAPERYRSVAMGVVIFGMQAVGMAGPWIAGIISMRFGLATALVAFQASFVVAAIGLALAAVSYRANCAAVEAG